MPATTPAFQCACSNARRLARTLTQLYDSRLRMTGMEAPQFALLMTLEMEGACSQAVLGRRHSLDKTTMSRNLKLLQSKGWIELTVVSDGRLRQFVLTRKGRKLLMSAKVKWKKIQDQLSSVMGEKEWANMFRTFSLVTSAADGLKVPGDYRGSPT